MNISVKRKQWLSEEISIRKTKQICDLDTKFVKILYDSASSLVYDLIVEKGSVRFSISTSRNTRFDENLLTRRHSKEHPRRGDPRAIRGQRVYPRRILFRRDSHKNVRIVEIDR